MAINESLEPSVKRCGEAVARYRTSRGLSRARLIARVYDELEPDDPLFDSISEAWLKRLENGQMVKVPRRVIEVLCHALQCSPQERAHILLQADRTVFNDAIGPDEVAEALTYLTSWLYAEAHEILKHLMGQRRAAKLDEYELLELTAKAIDLVVREHQERLGKQ